MLAMLSLLGVAMMAAAFVDDPGTDETADQPDDPSLSPDGQSENMAASFDMLLDEPPSEPQIDDFEVGTDVIEIEYTDTPPVLSTSVSDAGLTLMADGAPVATLAGIDALDLDHVALIPV